MMKTAPNSARSFLRPVYPVLLLAVLVILEGCAVSDPAVEDNTIGSIVPQTRARVPGYNRPYSVRGKKYHPLPSADGYRERGLASWYGSESGNQTAMGVRFDPQGLSAAHRTLPLPTRLRVTNLKNGRQVEVVVNDRGPFVLDRLIDLSHGAARALGIRGTAIVQLEALPVRVGGTAMSSRKP
jgi:rare lipoprotein A